MGTIVFMLSLRLFVSIHTHMYGLWVENRSSGVRAGQAEQDRGAGMAIAPRSSFLSSLLSSFRL